MYVNVIFDIDSIPAYGRRMTDPKDTRIITPMPQSLVDRIDDYRFRNRIASRAEAIRRLVEMGLQEPDRSET